MASLTHLLASRDRVFYDRFDELVGTAVRATEHLDELLAHFPERHDELFQAIVDAEHEADTTRNEIRTRLNQTFVTPIDREDILSLSSALDDIVDFTEEAADFLGLYGIEAPMEQSQHLAALLVAATRNVALAVPCIRGFQDANEYTREIHRIENEADRVSRDAIAALFGNGIDPMVVIRWKDIYTRLEQAIDACEHAADVIDQIIIKNR